MCSVEKEWFTYCTASVGKPYASELVANSVRLVCALFSDGWVLLDAGVLLGLDVVDFFFNALSFVAELRAGGRGESLADELSDDSLSELDSLSDELSPSESVVACMDDCLLPAVFFINCGELV